MLTRAYDAIMASLQVSDIVTNSADFNSKDVNDGILNCKDLAGTVRCICSPCRNGIANVNEYCHFIPLSYWRTDSASRVFPDENASEPCYEDYSVAGGTPSGWTASSQHPSFSKSYDQGTKEIVCTVKCLWQNTSGAAKTVYGVNVVSNGYYRPSYSGSATLDSFLVCREHFAAPVVVEDQGIISLTFTYRVGRAGLVSATAAAAE